MRLQKFDPRMVSITQVRRDIGVLQRVLKKEDEAFVMRNQDLMFVAMAPGKYRRHERLGFKENGEQVAKAVQGIDKIRRVVGRRRGSPATDALVKLRDERVGKWTRQ